MDRVPRRVDRCAPESEGLEEIRRQLAALPEAASLSRDECELAQRICALRTGIARAIGSVRCCRSCARGRPLPVGRWNGGACCAHDVRKLFSESELRVARAAGSDETSLAGPCVRGAGCSFRSARGCELPPARRPNPCVTYLCQELADELEARGDLGAIRSMCQELETLVAQFIRIGSLRAIAAELSALL